MIHECQGCFFCSSSFCFHSISFFSSRFCSELLLSNEWTKLSRESFSTGSYDIGPNITSRQRSVNFFIITLIRPPRNDYKKQKQLEMYGTIVIKKSNNCIHLSHLKKCLIVSVYWYEQNCEAANYRQHGKL